MSIKSDVLWDAKTKTFVSNVNYSNIVAKDGDTATEKCLSCYGSWPKTTLELPNNILFGLSGLTAKTQSQIIKESINLTTDASLEVHAVIFNGCSKNLASPWV